MNGRPISKRYRKFAPEYVSSGFNGTEAVLRLGWTDNRKSANVIAHRLLSNVNCQQLIEKHVMSAKMSADEVIEELSSVAKSDTQISEQSKMKALEMLAKAHNLVDKRAEQPRDTNTSTDLSTARQSYILAALPELQQNNPNMPIIDLQALAEQKFTQWLDSLNLTPLASNLSQ